MLGVPYAQAIVENGQAKQVCPVCGAKFTGRRYAVHYQKEHENGC